MSPNSYSGDQGATASEAAMMGRQIGDQTSLFYEFRLDDRFPKGYCYGLRSERKLTQEVELHLENGHSRKRYRRPAASASAAAMQAATTRSNIRRKRSLCRNRCGRFSENVEWCGTLSSRSSLQNQREARTGRRQGRKIPDPAVGLRQAGARWLFRLSLGNQQRLRVPALVLLGPCEPGARGCDDGSRQDLPSGSRRDC